jgi:hypothetical protein
VHSLFRNNSISAITFRKIFLVIILIPIGLYTKVYSGIGHEFICNRMGGIIYVIFFIVLASLAFPKARPIKLSLIVLGITSLLELSQLIHNDILDDFRTNFIFRALFGNVFNAFDFLYYIIGALVGFGILNILYKRISV